MLASLLRRFTPATKTTTSRVRLGQNIFPARSDQTLLESALQAGVDFPYNCQAGACGECRCKITHGGYTTLRDLGYLISEEDQRHGHTLACQTVADADLTVELACGPVQWIDATLVECSRLDHDILELRIKTALPVTYRVGQYVHLLEPVSGIRRAYSMVASSDPRNDILAFHIKLRTGGKMSDWLQTRERASEKSAIKVGAPMGTFGQPAADIHHFIAVASGSGLGVISNVLAKHADASKNIVVWLFLVSRDAISRYHESQITFLNSLPNLTLLVTNIAFSDWCSGEYSPFQHVTSGDMQATRNCQALLCGSAQIVDWGARHCAAFGLPEHRIQSDKFTAIQNLV